MTVHIQLFAAAKDLAGADRIAVQVAEGATIATVRREVMSKFPALEKIGAVSLWAVDAEYATETTRVSESSEIALIPPVSGG